MRISNWSSDVCSSDLLPVSVADGLWGNSAAVFGGNQANGSYSAGVGATLFQDYEVDLKYTDYFGSTHDDGTKVTSQNGFTSLLKERGFVARRRTTTYQRRAFALEGMRNREEESGVGKERIVT